MSGRPGEALSDPAVRDALLDIASRVVQDLGGDRQVTKQAATAQAVLLRDGREGLEKVLDADYAGGSTARYWSRFRAALRPRLGEISAVAGGSEADALAFTLGWIRRLGASDPARDAARGSPAQRRGRRS